MELLVDINWLAVLVGAGAAFLVGWIWYSEILFGEKWRQGIGTPAVVGYPMFYPMGAQAVGTFLFAWVIGVAEALGSLALTVLVALAFTALLKANGFFAGKSKYAIAVESGYILTMAAIIVLAHMLF